MGESSVKVLGAWSSPFVMRVRIALHLKSLNYEFVEENMMQGKSELLLKSNPVHKKIPVVIHGGNPICESLVIVHYIDEVWPSAPSILPSDPYERSGSRFWAACVDDKVCIHNQSQLRRGSSMSSGLRLQLPAS
ncbi:Glutathione S-transferase U17 [Hibiscus syriacus]|uniref:Glutathione S-transferase n=1 Tax=Hibiscus syriacus TaxID=106335 RepID=A0A6A3B7Q8_HIBSY|nr:probable glutathione S-transferase GSTU6 [Hibiscus syriacus]KAE8711818.1 Glutathione S-transferase U17 [Hibiscus syriacus]